MNNKGKVTVFLCLMTSVLLLLGTTMLHVISVQLARTKAAMCTRTALSNVEAGYNRYIYDHYHILLFDKSGNGKGEGYIEQMVFDNLQENLGDDFEINNVQITEYKMLYEDNCQPFKEQMSDYIKYAAVEYGTDYIKNITGGKDGELSDEVFEQSFESPEFNPEQLLDSPTSDPRDKTGKLRGGVLLATVIPDDFTVSDYSMTYDDVVPIREMNVFSDFFEVDSHFNDYDAMKNDMKSYGSWSDSLAEAGVDVAYAANVFNNALEQEINDSAVLCCELEYLVCGFPSDTLNMRGVVNRIVAMRMPINYLFLLSNPEKKSVIVEVASAVSAVTLIPLPIMEHLIAGCWAYAEAVAEVKHLLNGDKMAFTKTNENWITDLDNLDSTIHDGGSADDKGLSYKDYLLILLAMNNKKCVYRMLDLMQLNARQENAQFDMLNAATGLEVNVEIESEGQTFYFKEERHY